MTIYICHVDGEDCWYATIDDQECQGRFATYVLGESTLFRYGEALPA